MNDLISIIIPVYNGQKTLTACLDSIIAQTETNWELIVVDNNSTDRTKEVIQAAAVADRRIHYVFEPKPGRGAARNAGLKFTRGKIILMTDSDCLTPPDWIKKITEPIINDGEQVVVGFAESAEDNFWSRQTQEADRRFIYEHLSAGYLKCLDTKNLAARREIFDQILFDDEITCMEDFDFYWRLKDLTKIKFAPAALVIHHHPTSFSHTVKTNFWRAGSLSAIYDKYPNMKITPPPMVDFVNLRAWFYAPIHFIKRNQKSSPGQIYFSLITGLAWLAGSIWGRFKSVRS